MGHMGQPIMNEFENFAEFEKQKHIDFFLPYYKKRGWIILEDNLGNSTDWDVRLETSEGKFTIDEKARSKEYDDFLVEIVQDLKSGNKGWLFKDKDYYFYASWRLKDTDPSSFYCVDARKLQEFVIKNWKSLLPTMQISEKGWGVTLFAKIMWQDLISTKIAKKLDI